jgi:hypothetical protein
MNRIVRKALVFIICLSIIPTATRFVYYEYKFASLSNLKSSPISNLKDVENFPSSKALTLLSNDPTARVLTFRQSDLISLDRRNWIDNFDPRAAAFFQAESEYDLFELLRESRIKYILVPNYTWPTIYNTKFMSLLSNPAYSEPLIPNVTLNSKSDSYQLFLIRKSKTSTSCVQEVIKDVRFFREKGGLPSRLFDALLGIPTTYQGSLQDVNISDLNKFENLGLNQSTLLRNLKGDVDWYNDGSQEYSSSRLIVKVKTKSSSLIKLSVQGISQRTEFRNLLKVGRLVNVAESLSAGKTTSLGGQFLASPDVGSIRIFLSSFSGPEKISNQVQLQICQVKDNLGVSEPPLENTEVALSNQPTNLALNLQNCDNSGTCESTARDEPFWKRLNLGARSVLKSGYMLTQKIYTLNDRTDLKLQEVFNYTESSLLPYSFRCISNCPSSGLISLEWTNLYGFRTRIILAASKEVDGTYSQVFVPLLSNKIEPEIVLTRYSGTSTRNAIYEFWREDVKR